MNIVLVATLLILAGFALAGLKSGLIKMVFSLISTIAALLVAVIFSPVVSNLLESHSGFSAFLTEKVEAVLESAVSESEDMSDYIEGLPFPETIKNVIRENDDELQAVSATQQVLETYVCQRIVSVIIKSISFAVTFFAALLALVVLCRVLDLISRLPLLNEINHMAGLAAGLAEGILVVWILFVVLTMFAGTEFGKSAMQMISENALLSFLYDNNLLSGFITK